MGEEGFEVFRTKSTGRLCEMRIRGGRGSKIKKYCGRKLPDNVIGRFFCYNFSEKSFKSIELSP